MEKRRQKYMAALMFIAMVAMIPVIGSHTAASKHYYISITAAGLLFVPFLFIIFRIIDMSRDSSNIFEYLGKQNKFIGKAFYVVYSLYAFVTAITSLRIVGEEITLMSLFNTPMIVLFLFAVALYVFILNNGYRVIGHLSVLYCPIMVIGVVAYVLLSTGNYEGGNFEPVFVSQIKDISFSSANSLSGIFGDFVLLLFISGIRKNNEKIEPLRKRYFLIAYAVAFLCIVLTVLNSLLVIGGEAMAKLYFPHYISVSLINISFITRLEIIVDILYFIALNIKIAFSLFCAITGFKYVAFNEEVSIRPKRKYINLIFCLLCGTVAAYAFGTTRDFFEYLKYYRIGGIGFLFILLLLWLTTEIVVRRGRIKAGGEGKLNTER